MAAKQNILKTLSIIAILAMIFSNLQPSNVRAQGGGGLRRHINAESGKVAFIRPESGKHLSAPQALGTFVRPEDPAMALAKRFGPEFGLKNPERDLSEMKNSRADDGRLTVRYQQKYQGIPVMGGELIVNTNVRGDLYSMNGEVSSDLSLSTQPVIDSAQAKEIAIQSLAKWYEKSPEEFIASEPDLWIYDESLLQPSTRPAELVWRMEVTSADSSLPVRELVLVNASRGGISLHFNQVDTAWTTTRNSDSMSIPTPEPPQPTETPLPTETPNSVSTSLPEIVESQFITISPVAEPSLDQAAELSGATWYVAATGSDSNSCSSVASPCFTIDSAIVKASAGDTILVAQGVYTSGRINGPVVYVTKAVNISGGWNSLFTHQNGTSIIDGMNTKTGFDIHTSATIDHFTVQNANGTYGGGIGVSTGTVTLNNVFIHSNRSVNGAGIYQFSGNLYINNSTLSENVASSAGGGIYFQAGSLTINNSTITGNKAYQGGGYYNYGSSIVLRNSILAKNIATIGTDCSGVISLSDHTIIGNTFDCTITTRDGDKQNIDPSIAPIPIGVTGYHPLLSGSPAIDAGNPNTCTLVDQRGIARPQGNVCDIGAYEYTVPGSVATMVILGGSNQTAVPGLEFDKPLTVYLADQVGSPVSGGLVLFTAPQNGPSVTFANGTTQTSTTTNNNGVAVSPVMRANSQVGNFTVSAQLSGNPAISTTFSLKTKAWYVSAAGSDSNSCLLPALPCAHINSAINKSQPGDVILIASGEYLVNPSEVDKSQVLKVDKSLTLLGGWNSNFTAQNGMTIVNGENQRRGVYITSGTSKLNRFIIKNGYSGVYGGGIYVTGNNKLILTNSTVLNNRADYGGGIYAYELILDNSTVSGNSAGSWGGGLFVNGLVNSNNSTIASNNAWVGGGVYVQGNAYITNSILAHNMSGHAGMNCYGNVSSEGHNIVSSTAGCTITSVAGDQLNVDPQFVSLVPTPEGYHPLKSNSPAINNGNPGTCLPTDQSGFSRIGICDIGSYEYRLPAGPVTRIAIAGGDNQRIGLNLAFPKPLQVMTLDSQGVPAGNGLTITFTAPANGPSGIFKDTGTNITTVVTNSDGIATAPTFTANSTNGSYSVSASAAGIASPVSFALNNVVYYVIAYPIGSNINDCLTPQTACGSIDGAITKAASGDTIRVAVGTYTNQMLSIPETKAVNLSGGWNTSFTDQTGFTYVDGQNTDRTLSVYSSGNKIEKFVFQNGYGWSSGGNIYIGSNASLSLSSVTVRDGRANQNGAGVHIDGGSLFMVNSTVTSNIANGSGGGIYIQSGSLTSEYSTITNNTASTSGGGVKTFSGNIILNSSILAKNYAVNGPDCSGSIAKSDQSIIGDTATCVSLTAGTGNNFNIDPQLSSGPIGPVGYHALYQSSPARGAGDQIRCPARDERGISRPQNNTCDSGSYEFMSPGTAASFGVASGSKQKTTPLTPFALPLKVYVVDNAGNPVPGRQVTFTTPGSGASGTFTNNATSVSILTDGGGIATAPQLTANIIPGPYVVIATVAGLSGSSSFSLTNHAIYINPVSGNDTSNCLTPATACKSLSSALWIAGNGETIFLASGTYTGSDINSAVANVNKNVTISGGWNGSFLSKNGVSIIDGQNTGRGFFIEENVTATISRIKIINCRTPDAGYIFGGGIYNQGTLLLEDSSLLNCRAYNQYNDYRYGGGIYNYGILTLDRVSITGGSATLGGGIYHAGGQLRVTNTTISGNTAESGGAIYIEDGVSTLNNVTVYQNVATGAVNTSTGGGIANPNNKLVSIGNTILAGNAAETGSNCKGSISSLGHNIITIAEGCNILPADGDQIGDPGSLVLASLGNLADNGGLTLTNALLTNSPAIDAGNPSTCATVDQRGILRPQGVACDIGAFEGAISQITSAVIKTYTANYAQILPGTFLCDTTNLNCTNNTFPDADSVHKFAVGTYKFYNDTYGRKSIDNNNMPIISTVRYQVTGIKYDNAFWSGAQMVYGDAHGYARADDIVAHELTHGVTQYESNLFYYYQSGAINESFSDLWGEYYDQINGQGNDTAGVKWRIGEDIEGWTNPAPQPSLGLRDMKDPTLFSDPDRMTNSYYYKGTDDNGGVHWNSGVNNKAVYLMVDGGTFNSKTVTALGWEKVGAIYYEAQTNLLASGADYSDLYYALQQACTNLIGQKGIAAGDCIEVRDALDAVEMNAQPVANFNTDAPVCSVGTPVIAFADDLENGITNWTFNNGNQLRWQYDSPWGQYAQSGEHFLFADDYPQYSGTTTDARATLKSFVVPSNAYLHFAHAYEFENDPSGNYDGGVLEYSANGGSTWLDAGPLMEFNGYKGTINSNYINPLKGRLAFVGSSHGYISTRLDLSSLVSKTVSFRWRMGLDDYGVGTGWWLDNIKVYTCISRTISGNAGAAGATLTYTDGLLKKVISQANGSYSLPVGSGWSGTVTPSHPCYTFNPPARSYTNVTTNQTGQNFTATFTPTPACKVTVGVFRPSNGVIFLRNSNTTGFADVALNYGLAGDYPVVGDWDGDGDDTIGVYRNGRFLLRNSNTVGFAEISFPFGQAGDQPIAGDWDGDGVDTIGIFRPSTGQFLLRNSNDAGLEDASFFLGNVGDVGIAGDWNGDGIDTTGVFRPSNGVIFLKNTNETGFADVALNYGLPGDKPVVGDWDGDGDVTIGIFRNGRFYLRNSNTNGFADIILDLGFSTDMPIAGNWDGLP